LTKGTKIKSGRRDSKVLCRVERQVGEVDCLEKTGSLGSNPDILGIGSELDANVGEEVLNSVANFFVSNDFVTLGNPAQGVLRVHIDYSTETIISTVFPDILLGFNREESIHVSALVRPGVHRNVNASSFHISSSFDCLGCQPLN
jgi:hypothetical protein